MALSLNAIASVLAGTRKPLTQYLGQVATGTFINDNIHPNNTQSNSRTPHYARQNITSLQIVIPNWYVISQTETNGSGTATWTASVEYPAGTFTQILFAGVASGSVTAGNNLISDAVTVSIPNGAKFWIRMFQTTTGRIMYQQYYAGDGTAQIEFGVSGLADKTMSGTLSTTVGSKDAAIIAPCAIIANTTLPSVGVYGDSISVGRGDSDGVGRALQGHLGRAFGAQFACGHVGISGDSISKLLASNSKRIGLLQYFSHVAINMGINDITGGASAATVQSDTNSMISLFGSKPVAVCTMSPVSSGTWTTVGGQTTSAFNSVRVAVNTQRLTNLPLARFVFDVNPTVENTPSPEDGLWTITGGANTDDGTHHNAVSASRLVQDIRTGCLVS